MSADFSSIIKIEWLIKKKLFVLFINQFLIWRNSSFSKEERNNIYTFTNSIYTSTGCSVGIKILNKIEQ